jgi:hypothetical protein
MSMVTQKSDTRNIVSVIFLAYRDKPSKLFAVKDYGKTIEVYGTDKEKRICLPISGLFRFDDALFAELEAAYQSGNTERLVSLWTRAEQFKSEKQGF